MSAARRAAARLAPARRPRFVRAPRALRALLACAVALGVAGACGRAHAQGFRAAATKDGIDAWAVGDSGRVWRTLDGGVSWVPGVIGASAWRAVQAHAFTVLLAGDSAKVLRSSDDGGTWTGGAVPGATRWRALARASATRVFVCGDAGRIARSDDDGVTWTLQWGSTAQVLRAIAFRDDQHGWACGDAGTLLATNDGGAHWAQVALPTTRALDALAAPGVSVWVGGEAGALFHSTDAGAHFAPYDLRAGEQPDVRALVASASARITVAGGGGFVRTSGDDGRTWEFIAHPLFAPIAALAIAADGGRGLAVSDLVRVPVMGGMPDVAPGPWSLPAGATVNKSFVKVGSLPSPGTNVRGNSLAIHPYDKRVMYNVLGATLYRSPDEGEHWNVAQTVGSISRTNQLLISPKDTTVFIAAMVTTGGARQIMRSTDAGQSWSIVLMHAFGEYGTPLEAHPLHPDTLYFGGENDTLMRSLDFGLTWKHFGTGVFRSPCDLAVLPDSGDVILVSDAVTNVGLADFWRSDDGGATFTRTQVGSSNEAPALATSRLRPSRAFVTSWTGIGARMSDDGGASWPLCPDLNRLGQNVAQTWGADIAHDDPGVVWIGTFASGRAYLSVDGGDTFAPSLLPNPNYAVLARDRATVFAQQSDGLYKLRVSTATPWASAAQSLALLTPGGGETWLPGSAQAITWSATGVALVRIEWRPDPAAAWEPLALVDGDRGTYAWTVPARFTSAAELRVSDAWDSLPLAHTAGSFAIHGPLGACADAPLDLGVANFPAGGFGTFTIRNDGDQPLHVSAVTSDRPAFRAVRSAFTVDPGALDTLGVRFEPLAQGPDSALVTLTTDDAATTIALRARASASALVEVGGSAPRALALLPSAPDPVMAGARTRLRFELPRAARVRLELFGLQGQRVATLLDGTPAAGRHELPFTPAADLPAGVYFLRLRADGAVVTRRLLVLR